MTMHPNKYVDLLLKLALTAALAGVVYVLFKFALPLLAPLIVAYLFSCMIARPVNFLSRKKILPRKVTAGIFTLLIVTLAALLLWGLVSILVAEGAGFINSLPERLTSLTARLDGFASRLDGLRDKLPILADLEPFSLESLLGTIKLPQVSVSGVASSLWGAATSMPMVILTVVFVLMATFFLTAQREEIIGFVEKQLSASTFTAGKKLKEFLFNSVWKWIKAQCLLICFTFCVMMVGFLLIKQPYALLLAFCIAFIDALPILGVGAVMIPWALYDLLTASYKHAIAILLIYAAVLVVRNSIEPRVVGGQLGLHPFVTLLCLYFGFRLAGFMGMFLLPVTILCLIKLREWGHLKLWR